MIACNLGLLFVLASSAFAAPTVTRAIEEPRANQTLERFLRDAAEDRHQATAPVTFEIDASLPRLKKHGIMRGLRAIVSAGRVVYTPLQFVGDDLIKTAVIARFLKADSRHDAGAGDVAITNRRYRFRYTGTSAYNGRIALVFRTDPRARDVGLFRGELWLDSETAKPLREWG